MPSRPLDSRIDSLYQLPLEEFTAARNALAKELASTSKEDAAEVRALQKPSLPAWAINQVYWHHRPAYHALDASSAALRGAHAAVVAGKRGDLRAAGKAHEDALDAVLKAALALVQRSGNPATDATRQAIGTTLRALPGSGEQAGRLSKTLQPGGFELLAGLPASAGGAATRKATPARAERTAPARETGRPRAEKITKDAARAKAIAKAREAVTDAVRAQKSAEQNARRDEFEAARASRDAERAAKRLSDAREALESAQAAADEAERDAASASRLRDAAARRVRESADTLAAARVRTEAAQAELARAEDRDK